MTEEEYLSTDRPLAILEFLMGRPGMTYQGEGGLEPKRRISDRKLRLYTANCAIRAYGIDHALDPEKGGYHNWIEGNRDVDDPDDDKESPLRIARSWCEIPNNVPPSLASCILREISGNPFYKILPSGVWFYAWAEGQFNDLTDSISKEAWDNILPEGTLDPVRLCILADALEENGFREERIIRHLHDLSINHYRGCWALDIVLGED
jgi:hypothetical protein